MLYVFQVETGTMLTFDMNLALESVATLQSHISSQHAIPPPSQVLLISGGECLSPDDRVTTGTDTNPIFLFNKANIEADKAPTPVPWTQESFEIVEALPSYQLLGQRWQLGTQIHDASKEIIAKSETLIQDQHLQHQGWAAVVANLEDVVLVFKKRLDLFITAVEKEESVKVDFDVVEGLPSLLPTFQKIPLPSSLATEACINLHDYLQSNELTKIPSDYNKTSELLEKPTIEGLIAESQQLLEKQNQKTMTEIKGLSERLYILDQLLETSRKCLKEQQELANSLATTTTRYKTMQDDSILPDLCDSHKKQLQVMVENFKKLQNIQKRCYNAKKELCSNLNTRLKWVIVLQKSISELYLKIGVYFEGLKKFSRLKTGVKQLHNVKETFFSLKTEVARRQAFEKEYNQKLQFVMETFKKQYEKEKERRNFFKLKHGDHFLYNLFGDMDSFPSDYFDTFESHCLESDEFAEPEIIDLCCHGDLLKDLKLEKEKELNELNELHEREIIELKEKAKSEIEVVKSRVKLVARCVEVEKEEKKIEEENSEMNLNVPSAVISTSTRLNLPNTCKIGDRVLIFYSDKYEAFIVHNNSSTLHFLHTSCVEDLVKEYCYLGNVIDKEYCVARRAQNRYSVPQGFHFYRVKTLITDKFQL